MKGRIVVKIGSQVLCDPRGELNLAVLAQLAGQIAGLAADGWQVLVVSSGAVAAGHGVAGEAIHRVSDPVGIRDVQLQIGADHPDASGLETSLEPPSHEAGHTGHEHPHARRLTERAAPC